MRRQAMLEDTEEVLGISGRVVELTTGQGLEGFAVEAWNREKRLDEILGSSTTDGNGNFRIILDVAKIGEWLTQRQPEAYFKVIRDDRLLLGTEETTIWRPLDADEPVTIELDMQAILGSEPWLEIATFDELVGHELEILKRIGEVPHGGNLFMAHPLMLLRDIGVVLSEEAQSEIMAREPHLSALSRQPYLSLRRSQQEQKVRFHIRGLFREVRDEYAG
jgi:hypothetical protein